MLYTKDHPTDANAVNGNTFQVQIGTVPVRQTTVVTGTLAVLIHGESLFELKAECLTISCLSI